MEMREIVGKVEDSAEWKDFHSKNPGYYLATVFQMVGKGEEQFQVGYYSQEKDEIIVFEIPIKQLPADKVFKQEGDTVKELKLDNVSVKYTEADSKAEANIKEKYPAEVVNKKIAILQHLDRPTYNFTFVTATFNIINIKIDATTNEITFENKHSVLDLGEMMPGKK